MITLAVAFTLVVGRLSDPFFNVENDLHRRNVLAYRAPGSTGPRQVVRLLPLFPTLGLEWQF